MCPNIRQTPKDDSNKAIRDKYSIKIIIKFQPLQFITSLIKEINSRKKSLKFQLVSPGLKVIFY